MTNKQNSNYDINSMDRLEGAESIRLRPASMLGSGGLDGAKHTFWEILGNGLDEVTSGYSKKLEVRYHPEDGSISVRDYGRGVPMTWSEKLQDWGWSIVYNTLYAGGKLGDPKTVLIGYDDWDNFSFKDFSYLASVGLNGVGAACSQFTSEFFRVISYRDGKEYEMYFEAGYPAWDEMKISEQSQENGTYVHWKPDNRVFTSVDIPASWYKSICKGISSVSGVDIYFYEGDKETFYPATTISESLSNALGGAFVAESRHLLHESVMDQDDNEVGVLVCEAFVSMSRKGASYSFYNNQIPVRGGVHADYSESAILHFLSEKAKERGERILMSDILGKYSLIVSTFANEKSYRGQTKDSIDNKYIGDAVYIAISNLLQNSWLMGDQWLKDLLEEAIQSAQLRAMTEAARVQLKDAEKKLNKKVMPDKFISCEYYSQGKSELVELFLVEGDSAGGAAKNGRDGKTQAILKLKGKTLNTKKATIQDALDNNEFVNLVNVLGTGITSEVEGFNLFDISKLKVGKIIIMTDADVDGGHIRTLLLNTFGDYLRPLLEEGYVFLAVPPKYYDGANDTYYYSDEEFNQAKKEGKVSAKFERFKGLGQMNAEQLWDTTMNPANRRLIPVIVSEDDIEFDRAMSIVSGKDSSHRKMYLIETLMGGSEELEETMNTLNQLYEDLQYEDVLDTVEVVYG